ncbi:RHS repeat-associated core domain-containing protein, partial [Pantoea agglomerans]
YDEAGNLTQICHSPAAGSGYTTRITVSNRSNRGVLSTLTENPSEVDALFTAGGQQTRLQPGQSLVWTPRNELLKVTPVVRAGYADDRESYRYDGNSQRLLKVSVQKTGSSTQTQRALYLPGLELRTTKAGSTETESLQVITVGEAGRAQVRVLHWTSGRPAEITGGRLRYSYDNLTGSSGLELDDNGNVISMEEYYPYGGTAVWTARSAVEADYKTVRYSGKERDATGLYYYGYRYYQPWAGRWLSSDPAGTVDGLNTFSYVGNNPTSSIDIDGRMLKRVASFRSSESVSQVVKPFQETYPPSTENEAREISVSILAGVDNLREFYGEVPLAEIAGKHSLARANELLRRVANENWPVALADIAHAEAASVFTQSRSGTIFNHNGVIIKSLLQGATEAVLFAHGGMSLYRKVYREKVVIPQGVNLHYYSEHTQSTMSGVGFDILNALSTEEFYAEDVPVPVETIRSGEVTHKYSLSNASEGEHLLPTAEYDIICIEPISNMAIENRMPKKFTDTIIEAIKIYRPEITDVHAIHCRAVFDRSRQRVYS